jgi:hypothetical protein
MIPSSVLCAILVCGVCAAQTQQSSKIGSTQKWERASDPKKPGFKVTDMGELDDNGIPMGFSDFVAPDGIRVHVRYLRTNDAVRANQAFERELSRAAKIEVRREKKNTKGEVVLQRVQLLMPGLRDPTPRHEVAWTDGSTFHLMVSSSLEHVLILENLYRY